MDRFISHHTAQNSCGMSQIIVLGFIAPAGERIPIGLLMRNANPVHGAGLRGVLQLRVPRIVAWFKLAISRFFIYKNRKMHKTITVPNVLIRL